MADYLANNGMQHSGIDEYLNTFQLEPRDFSLGSENIGPSWPEIVDTPQSETITNIPQVGSIQFEPESHQHQEILYGHRQVEGTGPQANIELAIPHVSPVILTPQAPLFTQNMMGHNKTHPDTSEHHDEVSGHAHNIPNSIGSGVLGHDLCDFSAHQPYNMNELADAHESSNTTDRGIMRRSEMDEYLLGDVSMGSGNRATSGSSWAGRGDYEPESHQHQETLQSPYGYRQVEETGPQANTQLAVPPLSPVMPTAHAPVFTQNVMGHNTAYPGISAHHSRVSGSAPNIPNSIGVPIASGSGNSRYDFRDSRAHQPHNVNEQTNAHESSNTIDRGVTVELRRLREENRLMRRFIRSLLESD